MDMKSVCLSVLVISLQFVCGRCLKSPCPKVFGYETDDDGKVYGEIVVRSLVDEPVSYLELKVKFTIEGSLIGDYKGHIETIDSLQLLQMFNQGQPVSYRLNFPVTSPLPKITSVIVNGDNICEGPGDTSKLGKRITTVSLQHWARSVSVDPVQKPVTSTQMVTNRPVVMTHRPVVTARPDHVPITTSRCGEVAGGNENPNLLIENSQYYERGEIPWLVAIYRSVDKNLQFICGGTLVSDRHVITAAHCMSRRNIVTPTTEIVVKIGVHRLNDWDDDITVTRKLIAATIHEDYDSNTFQNDILVLTLSRRVRINRYRRPACLWSGDTELSRVVGDAGVIAGWGNRFMGDIDRLNEPQMARVPIVSTEECRASKSDFHKLTYNTTLCAGARNGAGPCTGDSGGGLYLLEDGRWRLRGVISLSLQSENGLITTCNLHEYVVFTDTAQFLPWIRNILSM